MSHPGSDGSPDLRPIMVGEVWENPVTREYAKILDLHWHNQEGRAVAELSALVGARAMGEHMHPSLLERFTPLEGELTVKRNGKTSIVREGETAVIEPRVWHDWWNATDRNIRVRVEIAPGERFTHMIETFFGLARLGHTDSKGMPNSLQLALSAQEIRCDGVPRSTAADSADDLRDTWANCTRARLSYYVPAALAHYSGAACVALHIPYWG